MKRTALNKDTIRHYEKIGLLLPNRLNNNYFDYPESSVERIKLITHAKLLGMTLREIHALITDWENKQLTKQQKVYIFKEQLSKVDNKINDLKKTKEYLKSKLKNIKNTD